MYYCCYAFHFQAIEDGGEFEEDAEEEGRYGIETYGHNEQVTFKFHIV